MILLTYLGELSALLRNNCLYLNIIEVKKMHPRLWKLICFLSL